MNDHWNVETQAYGDCSICSGEGDEGGIEKGCSRCLKRRIADIERQRETMAAALRPFAAYAASIMFDEHPDDRVILHYEGATGAFDITLGDFRKATAALSRLEVKAVTTDGAIPTARGKDRASGGKKRQIRKGTGVTEEPEFDDYGQRNTLACEDCGLPYEDFGLDVLVSDEMWERLTGYSDGHGILCVRCIVWRAAKLSGITVGKLKFE